VAALPEAARRIVAPEAPVCAPSTRLRALDAATVAALEP
jgi:hypothetical protein